MQTREWQFAWYFRDRWQATRKLTVNLGLRYEYYPLMNRGSRGLEHWDPYTNIVRLGGLGGVPREVGMSVSKKLFAPRFGFAYRVRENWVVRSGYGISFNPMPLSRPLRGPYPATLTGNWGAGTAEAEFRNSTYGWYNTLDKGIPDVPTPDVSKGTLELPLSLTMGARSPWGGRLHRGYIQSWNFTVNMAEDDGTDTFAMWQWEPMIPRSYAPSSQDRRHSFVLGWVYDLPFGRGQQFSLSGIADKILGGWKINGTFMAYTGTPFSVTGSGSSLQCIGCTQTADQIAPVRKIDQGRGPNQPYYDPMSFRDPLFGFDARNPVYRPGTMGRNVLYGPGFWRVNPAIYKEFQVLERVRAEFRAEATNATNTPRWNNPNSGSGSMRLNPDGSLQTLNNFMCITGASAQRQVRFGLRFQF